MVDSTTPTKNVIWTDETSVILGQKRGKERVWRTAVDRFHPDCRRYRWKSYSEFTFWGSFSYDKKGPYHIWSSETTKEKKEADIALAKLNTELEPIKKQEWELEIGMRRLGLRKKRGKQPIWKFTKATGKITRESKKGGIDWWRYQQNILLPKLLPFA